MSQVPIEELFAQFHQPLVRMLYRRTGDQDRAEDLAAEVFARALASPPDNPRPWLFAVALNLVRHDLGLSKMESRFPAKGTCLSIYSRAVNAEANPRNVVTFSIDEQGEKA